jgi:hypothetical protein
VRIGPTVNFLNEDDYERIAGGVRVNVPMGRHFELNGIGAFARGGNDAFDDESSYAELELRSEF